MLDTGFGRLKIDSVLIKLGLHHSINAKSREKHVRTKCEKIENSTMRKYGVKNVCQLPGKNGYLMRNKLPYTSVPISNDLMFLRFSKDVTMLTKRYHFKLLRKGNLPSYCALTGIRFADADGIPCNPNDPLKRSVDHIKPVMVCYASGMTPVETADPGNLQYILKNVNSIKGCSDNDALIRSGVIDFIKKFYEDQINQTNRAS